MENYNKDNEQEEYEYEYEYDDQPRDKTVKGLKVMIIVLAVILAGLSILYFMNVRQMKAEYNEERTALTGQLNSLITDYDSLRTENDTINKNLLTERGRADSLMQTIQKERNLSRAKIRDYEKQLKFMRERMVDIYAQLDSVDRVAKKLSTEVVGLRKDIAIERNKAARSEEKAEELNIKVRQGSVISARNIDLTPLNSKDHEVSRAKQASRMRVDCVLASNALATPGERNVYVRIIGPEGYIMPNPSNSTFNYEGDQLTYSAVRPVDYQNKDLSVSLFYTGSGITAGTYNVMLYVDGYLVGQTEKILR